MIKLSARKSSISILESVGVSINIKIIYLRCEKVSRIVWKIFG